MLRHLLSILILLIPIFISQPVLAKEPEVLTPQVAFETKKVDPRTKILKAYLAKYHSPLEDNAADFIEAADKYDLDWRLLPSITGVESTFGKHVPGGSDPKYTSYNGWGWGVYGTQAIYFKSWREGIFSVSEGLRKNYVGKGLTDPYQINRVYAASPTWGAHVTYFLNDLDKFASKYQLQNSELAAIPHVNYNVAGHSNQPRVITSALNY